MVLGVVIGAVFLWWEARAADPIVHLELFRESVVHDLRRLMFLAAFGFFGAVIFLPRWFQAIANTTATGSGLALLPLVVSLIVSATLAGQRRAHPALQAADLRLDGAPRVRPC